MVSRPRVFQSRYMGPGELSRLAILTSGKRNTTKINQLYHNSRMSTHTTTFTRVDYVAERMVTNPGLACPSLRLFMSPKTTQVLWMTAEARLRRRPLDGSSVPPTRRARPDRLGPARPGRWLSSWMNRAERRTEPGRGRRPGCSPGGVVRTPGWPRSRPSQLRPL